jgi:hypothetical protein
MFSRSGRFRLKEWAPNRETCPWKNNRSRAGIAGFQYAFDVPFHK